MKDYRFVAILFICFVIGIIVSVIYSTSNAFNPDSDFCRYRIYRQSDNTYEVWWISRSKSLEAKFFSYQEAKEFQINACNRMRSQYYRSPQGKHVK